MTEHITLVGLAVSLLGTLIVSTWRFASLATKLTSTIEMLEAKVSRVEAGLVLLDLLPELRLRVEQNANVISRFSSEWPRISSRLDVIEHAIKHSREMRAVLMGRGSRPDMENE